MSNSNEWLNNIIMYGSFRGLAAGLVLAGLLSVLMVESLAAQGTPADSADAESIAPEPTGGLPVFLTFRAGYGQRSDPCSLSWQVWRLFLRAGGGFAWGHQDIEGVDESGDATSSVPREKGSAIRSVVASRYRLRVPYRWRSSATTTSAVTT